MRMFSKQSGVVLLVFALILPIQCAAQSRPASQTFVQTRVGEALTSVGLQVKKTALDCSHFVNSVFEQAGLSYKYEPSRTLYRGAPGFQRVYAPAQGDLIVWPGHVGIVVDPQEKTFLSALTHGVKVASYTSRYWQGRGHPRFFRYSSPTPNSQTWIASNMRSAASNQEDGMD